MKKSNVLSKILCVFKPKKTPCDIVTEAENIINRYLSSDNSYLCIQQKKKRTLLIVNCILIALMATVGYITVKVMI